MFAKLLALANNKKRGFTLIELIVVIAIIGILIAILVPTVTGYVNDARNAQLEANARTVFVAAQAYLTQQSTTSGTVTATALNIPTGAALTNAHPLFSYLGAFNPNGVTYTVVFDAANYSVTSVTANDGKRTATVTSGTATVTTNATNP